ncbi:fumarylacetoacetate hydrolase family protein [Heliobacterium chlorum]|uniref:Fumarylacetoacetate hydrolase family protein n=1 Tax=Heliobacterium chlorum TaxID=2698 RepID=A0ABR7SYT3_HELCL|nr:fumarylacetoacetate hydrolase family protein [Heliobacterium chlorum]
MSVNNVRNIYCVGWNYRLHAQELGNTVPDSPIIFTKPTHALVEMLGQEIAFPADQGSLHYEAELVLVIGKAYRPGIKVDDLVDRMALGLDMTLRDKQNEVKKQGRPWLSCKGFLRSALITKTLPFPGIDNLGKTEFVLQKNNQEVQRGNASLMVFAPQALVDYIGSHYGLDAGDLIFTGTPVGVGPVNHGDHLALYWGEEQLGECTVRLA